METPSFFSILPAVVRYDERLTDSEKIFFSEITALSNKYGYCNATNGYFAKLYNVSKVTVSRRINKLKNCKHLSLELIREGKEIKERRIYPLTDIRAPINTNVNTPINNPVNTPINTNDKENSTRFNNTSINNNNSATNVASELENQLLKEFEEWWNLYDKKKDKKAAITKFKSARKEHSYEEIVKGTKEYLKTITNKQYQKHPKTFLHNESYLDDFSDDIKSSEVGEEDNGPSLLEIRKREMGIR